MHEEIPVQPWDEHDADWDEYQENLHADLCADPWDDYDEWLAEDTHYDELQDDLNDTEHPW